MTKRVNLSAQQGATFSQVLLTGLNTSSLTGKMATIVIRASANSELIKIAGSTSDGRLEVLSDTTLKILFDTTLMSSVEVLSPVETWLYTCKAGASLEDCEVIFEGDFVISKDLGINGDLEPGLAQYLDVNVPVFLSLSQKAAVTETLSFISSELRGERRYESVGDIIYTATAPSGSAEEDEVWIVRKLTYSAGAYVGTEEFSDVSWTNRAILV